MKKKLLVVNKTSPCSSFYANPKSFGIWCHGRNMENYIVIIVYTHGSQHTVEFKSYDVDEIQKTVDEIFGMGECK